MIRLAGAPAGEVDRFRPDQAVARLQHLHVVQVFEVGEYAGLPFFSMELCPGGSLAGKLAGNPLDPRDAAELVEKLALGLQAVDGADIVHRDVKPMNVLLAADGTPKVTVLGLANVLDSTEPGTVTGAVMGTLSDVAYEQAGSDTKARASVTCMHWARVVRVPTARPPFRGPAATR